MDLIRIRKIALSIIFLLVCGLMAYFQVIHSTLDQLLRNGYDSNTLYLVLTIPIITLLVSFSRTIIGISINTVYIPIIIILTALAIGLNYTLIILILSLLLAIISKYLISDFHYHFGSKISLIVSLVTMGLILTLPYLNQYNINNNLPLVMYGILITSVINEKFFNYKINKSNMLNDLKQVVKTVIFCVICYFILGGKSQIDGIVLEWPYLKEFILNVPEVILASLVLNILIGQYTGLRFDEFIRFRKLIFKNK